MAAPWEKYGPPAKKPWERYTVPQAALPSDGGDGSPQVDSDADSFTDILKAGGAGIARGIADLPGLPGSLGGLLESGLDFAKAKGYEAVTGKKPEPGSFFAQEPLPNPLSGQAFREGLSSLTGGATDYRGKGRIARDVGTAGEFVPGAAAFGGTSIPNLLRFGVLPGVASEEAGRATEGTGVEPYARIAAALLAPAAASTLSKLVTPFPASPERLRQAQTLANEGIGITAGQRTGSDKLRYMESELGGMAGQRAMERQGEQFTDAAMRRAGGAGRATVENVDDAFRAVGQQFDDLAARNTLVPDAQLVNDLRTTFGEYGNMVPPSARAPIVENMANDIVSAIRSGPIGGEAYQALRSRLDRMARGAQADPQLSQALRGFRESLDDAMERSIATANPADAGAWREARNQYRNLLVVERAATGAGENAAAGLISPSALRNATVAKQGRRNYARGQGDFADLARAGEAIMKPLPNSGTAGRSAARNITGGAGSITGGIASMLMGGGAPETMAAMLAGAALPGVAGRAIMSRPGQAYLGNQLLGEVPMLDARNMALINALLGQNASGQISQR